MSAAAGIRLLEQLAVALLAVAACWRWRRERSRAGAWLAATFASLGVVILLGSRLASDSPAVKFGTLPHPLVRLLMLAAVAFPFLLYSFADTFRRTRPVERLAVRSLVVVTIGLTLVVPRFPVAGDPGPRTMPYAGLVLLEWVVLSTLVVGRLSLAARRLPSVARQRARLLAAGAASVALALVITATVPRVQGTEDLHAGLAVVLLGSALFLVGVAPPRWLVRAWRSSDSEAVQAALAGLVRATEPAQVIEGFLPLVARMMGGRGAVIRDADGEVQAVTGSAGPAEIGAASAPELLRIPLRDGWLEVWATPYTPYFCGDDRALLEQLGSLLQMALERTAAQQREARVAAALAESQRLAQLGSWSWEPAADRVEWSAEMFRIAGSPPGSQLSFADYLHLVHPEDQQLAQAQVQRALVDLVPFDSEYRIVRRDGSVRWLNSRGYPVLDGRGDVARLVGTCQDITERRALQARLTEAALHDPLTGLPNRALLMDRLQGALNGRELTSGVAVLFIDIDRFKVINDSLGHEAGDSVLLAVGRRFAGAVRPGDTVARFGGDEFVVLCRGDGLADGVASRLRDVASEPVYVRGRELSVTVSIGIAGVQPGPALAPVPATAGELLRDADAAMYRAKAEGGGRWRHFAVDMRTHAMGRLDTETQLRHALAHDELRLAYQPIVSLTTGRVTGVEALVRWQHPTRGLILPGDFIPVAEESGLITQLGEWVLAQACEQLVRWSPLVPDLRMGVNLSGMQLRDPDLVQRLITIIDTSGARSSSLDLEITESALMEDAQQTVGVLQGLKRLGLRLSIDDFGTGYSSLSYLKRFPVDTLKIDRSFVEGLGREAPEHTVEDRAIVEAIVVMATTLGLHVVAEGIETEQQVRVLLDLGCGTGQGFHFGRPLPASAVTPILGLELSPRFGPAVPLQRPAGQAPSTSARTV